jgi:hypothetical protein
MRPKIRRNLELRNDPKTRALRLRTSRVLRRIESSPFPGPYWRQLSFRKMTALQVEAWGRAAYFLKFLEETKECAPALQDAATFDRGLCGWLYWLKREDQYDHPERTLCLSARVGGKGNTIDHHREIVRCLRLVLESAAGRSYLENVLALRGAVLDRWAKHWIKETLVRNEAGASRAIRQLLRDGIQQSDCIPRLRIWEKWLELPRHRRTKLATIVSVWSCIKVWNGVRVLKPTFKETCFQIATYLARNPETFYRQVYNCFKRWDRG